MKNLLLIVLFLLLLVFNSNAQITNLKVNGSSSDFNSASGELFGWSFNVPTPGDSTLVQMWVDTDANGILDKSVDVLWIYFWHIDGDSQGQNGPPDSDGLKNGYVGFQQKLGIAPGHYILLLRNHNQYAFAKGVITDVVSPNVTVSGAVKVPDGTRKKNITISMENKNDSDVSFWNALTDDNGAYSIKIKTSTTSDWSLRPDNNNNFGSEILSPNNFTLTINPSVSNYTDNNFTLMQSSAEIKGTVKDENGNVMIGNDVSLSYNMNYNRNARTDTAGAYRIGILSTEFPFTNAWVGFNQRDQVYLESSFPILNFKSGDVLTRNIYLYKGNAHIKGKVTYNGGTPGFTQQISISNADSISLQSFTDPMGNFDVAVSDKIYNYTINALVQIGTYTPVIAHPGDSNVILNISTTDIKPVDNEIPTAFNLAQNYPNPFNPSTTINYSIVKEGHVKLSVYNLLGNKVSSVVDEFQKAGNYSVNFNADKLASGIYFYKVESGSFSAVKKFILMK